MAKHPGASVQAARGHRQPRGRSEAAERKERAHARVERFAERQAHRMPGADADELLEALLAQIRVNGMAWFGKLEKLIERLHADYLRSPKDPRNSRPMGLGLNLETLAEEWNLPPEIMGYH